MIRLFVALNIPQNIKEEIIRLRNRIITNPLDYKWEGPDKLHLTLKFIGEVDEKKGYVTMRTEIGGKRIISKPIGDPIPRIC